MYVPFCVFGILPALAFADQTFSDIFFFLNQYQEMDNILTFLEK